MAGPVRAFARGLNVLAALNKLGAASSAAVAAAAGLPRPTVHRLLETLQAEGYVARGAARDQFRLTLAVRRLSEGFDDDAWITEIAQPVLAELVHVVVWPTDIATFERNAMVIRASTHRQSPLSIDRAMLGTRLPILRTATGRAYLAFCPPRERETILAALARGDDEDAAIARKTRAVQQTLAEIRRRGYATRRREYVRETSSIALPIRHRNAVLGCLNIIWIDAAIVFQDAVKRYLPALRNAVARVEAELQRTAAQSGVVGD